MRPIVAVTGVALALAAAAGAQTTTRPRGVTIADLTWQQAESLLSPRTVIVIPLGAQAKEHGPHLRLDNDFVMAEYFAKRVLQGSEVVIYPTLNYHFYPSFVEYPGSTTMTEETARDLIIDVVKSIARHGPRRFYILNTGISTLRPLKKAAAALQADSILLGYLNLSKPKPADVQAMMRQEGGTHADEEETSMMLYIAPDRVDMGMARKDYGKPGAGALTRNPSGPGTYSPTGSWGDPTLATAAKGRAIVEALVVQVLVDVERIRIAPIAAFVAP